MNYQRNIINFIKFQNTSSNECRNEYIYNTMLSTFEQQLSFNLHSNLNFAILEENHKIPSSKNYLRPSNHDSSISEHGHQLSNSIQK